MAQPDPVASPPSNELAAPSSCPDVEDLMAFALGKLEADRLEPVHEHLDACATCQRVLTDAAHALATAVTDEGAVHDDVEWNTTFTRGALVGGRYEIRDFIARGGMGEVYEAFDRELRERVALKTVSSTSCDNQRAVRRLKGEVQLARRVSHPNVCRIYDFGSHRLASSGAQLHYLTMEFVEGETLGQRLRLAGALPQPEARKVARELLLGLKAAHEAGVLHRDFKSDNVMLKAGADGQSTAVVLDFGLARALDHLDGASGSNSHVVGTFGYIAPEQLEGRPHTTASDIYAFGVVWFEMLTGELPFRSTAAPAPSALRALERGAPAPSRLNRAVPPEMDALVLGCLERAPGARYQTVTDILSRLDRIAPETSPRARRRASLGVVLLACVAAWVFYGLTRQRPEASGGAPVIADAPPVSAPPPVPQEVSSELRALAPQRGAAEAAFAQKPVPAPPPSLRAVRTTTPPPHARPGTPLVPTPTATLAAESPRESAAPPSDRGPTSVPSVAAPAPSQQPLQTAPTELKRPQKPDWENPFSKVGAALAAEEPRAT